MIFSKQTILSAVLLVFSVGTAVSQDLTREEYVNRYKHIAIAHMQRYGIPASITMAQGILESGNGNSRLARSSNNHFGIKCKKDWTGETFRYDDDEKAECFRKYPSVEASYQDHAEFLDRQPRYDSLFVYSSTDYKSWARGLKAAGYATAPDYAERLIRLIEENKLYLLDTDEGERAYAAAHGASETGEAVPATAGSSGGIDPDAYRVTINAHRGYNVYRTNDVCYVIAKKDDMYEHIASLFLVSPKSLRRFNDANAASQPSEGDIIYIEPKRKRWEGNTLLHTVRQGETLRMLAQSYGIKVKSLAKINKMKPDTPLPVGKTVKLR